MKHDTNRQIVIIYGLQIDTILVCKTKDKKKKSGV